jgi:hypothetical protein
MTKMKGCPSETPVVGDVFTCETCKHTVLVLRDCACDDCECVALACCGKAMSKTN